MKRKFSPPKFAICDPIQILRDSIVISESDEDSTVKSELYDDSALIYEALILNSEIRPDSSQNHLIYYYSAEIAAVEEASCLYMADSEETEEFVPKTEEASMTVVENFVPDTEDQVVMAMEIEAQGGDWRAKVANSMLQILLHRYFKLVRSNHAVVLVIFVGFAVYVIFVGG
ncbi:hypothetical protein C2S51_015532 [Perilla frutescens var. frutescens]|nr:hypothetical protein C2S51_015532 [Perilla frutescens var. frutescens]